MRISKSQAEKIIEHVSLILRTNVQVLDDKRDIIASNGDFVGKMNIPLTFEQEPVATLRLQTEVDEKMSHVAKMIGEMILKETHLEMTSLQKRERNRLLIESLFFGRQDLKALSFFRLTDNYHVATGGFSHDYELGYLYQTVEMLTNHHNQLLFTISHDLMIFLLPEIGSEELLSSIQSKVWTTHGINLNFGVGLPIQKREDVKNSFETAKSALTWAVAQKFDKKITYFSQLTLGMLLPKIPNEYANLYQTRILGGLTYEQREQFRQLLEVFSEHNGHLGKCAAALFIHKNTLNYQLNKIYELTGYNPRNYEDFVHLRIAFLLDA